MKEYGDDARVMNAKFFYPVSAVARQFNYYGLPNGDNIVDNIFFCNKCDEYVENKTGKGTNPFIRHSKCCTASFVEISMENFCSLMANCLTSAGLSITKKEIHQELKNLNRITDEIMYVIETFFLVNVLIFIIF